MIPLANTQHGILLKNLIYMYNIISTSTKYKLQIVDPRDTTCYFLSTVHFCSGRGELFKNSYYIYFRLKKVIKTSLDQEGTHRPLASSMMCTNTACRMPFLSYPELLNPRVTSSTFLFVSIKIIVL